ncbi:MAG TPA: NUDIX hydrolase N-terminal domain-containing protein [Vicinamibacteria bacterium]|nr:NUDIX hydrolase N-terminal domain-containing protein [Vicinamibacteria bacterium]
MSAGPDRRPDWLRWAQRLQSIAQAGLTYAADPYDRERYEELRAMAVEMASSGLAAPADEVRAVFASTLGYPTPKVDVRAVVFRGEELLLVRERRSGRWTLPGGWADAGDTPSLAAERETLEESGYVVRAEKLVALLDKSRHEHPPSIDYTYKVLIQCRLEGGAPATSHEIDAVGFFARSAVPDLDLDRTTPGQVELAWAHRADPSRPTDLD